MTFKTYTRARAAKAALNKILEAYELTPEAAAVETFETAEGRFYGYVALDSRLIDPRVMACICEDLKPGFNFQIVGKPENETPAELTEAAPAPRKSGYINEVSSVIKPTRMVHVIADSMPEAARKDVIAACRAQGIAYGTARTQYQAWKQNRS